MFCSSADSRSVFTTASWGGMRENGKEATYNSGRKITEGYLAPLPKYLKAFKSQEQQKHATPLVLRQGIDEWVKKMLKDANWIQLAFFPPNLYPQISSC